MLPYRTLRSREDKPTPLYFVDNKTGAIDVDTIIIGMPVE
jgi:hypothetical protein